MCVCGCVCVCVCMYLKVCMSILSMNLYTDSWLHVRWFSVRVVVSIFRSLHFPCLRSMLRNGWGGVGCLHIERKTTSVVYPRPRTTYVNTRLVEYGWCSLPAVCKTQLSAFASMLPRCTAHMLKTISLHFSRMNLNDCRFWDGPIVLQRLARFKLHHLQASNKHSVACHLWHPNLVVRSDTRFEELWVTSWVNLHTCWMLRNGCFHTCVRKTPEKVRRQNGNTKRSETQV